MAVTLTLTPIPQHKATVVIDSKPGAYVMLTQYASDVIDAVAVNLDDVNDLIKALQELKGIL